MSQINVPSQGYRLFSLVRNDGTLTLTDGDVVRWSTGANKILGVDVVKASSSTQFLAGVISGGDIAPGSLGQMQHRGVHERVKTTDSGVILGTQVVASGSAGKCSNELGGEPVSQVLGLALSSSAGSSGSQTAAIDIF